MIPLPDNAQTSEAAESAAPQSVQGALPALSDPAWEVPAEEQAVLPAPDAGSEPAQVRLLNAHLGGAALRFTLGPRLAASSVSPGVLTGYTPVSPGFRSVMLFDAALPWRLLYRAALPFAAGEMVTLAAVPAASGALELVRVSDSPCFSRGTDRACLRVVNLLPDSPGLDLALTDGRVVFTDLRFKEVTAPRRAQRGRYDLYIAPTPQAVCPDIETAQELPAVVTQGFLPGCAATEPLAAFLLEARSGATQTLCLMGTCRPGELRVKLIENY